MKKLIPAAILSVLLLSGCSTILKSNEPAPTIFSLRPSSQIQPIATKGVSKIIEVQRPSLPPGFDTARIAMYLENGRRLDYYAGAKWAAPLDETLQEFSSQTARRVLPNMIVSSPGQSIDTNYRLQIRVNDFQPVYVRGADHAPLLVASVSFALVAMPEERIVTSFTIENQEVAQANNLSLITAGLEHLLQSVEEKAFQTISGHLK